jgi:prepilin-type processing-associated H-X9-DG protein
MRRYAPTLPAARPGLSVLELLVVIAIVASLIGLLVPAVQKVRDAAALTQCRGNLKQIILAAHAYHDANRQLPPGYSSQTQSGVMVYLLPYLEQQSVFAALPTGVQQGAGGPWYGQMPGGGLGGSSPVSTTIAVLLCPADNPAAASYVNGTVQSESYGGGGGKLTLPQMLASSNPGTVAQGEALAADLNQIFYAAWAAQTLSWTMDAWAPVVAQYVVDLPGGSVTVQGGGTQVGRLVAGGMTSVGGTPTWSARGSFTFNGETINVNMSEADTFLAMINGQVTDLAPLLDGDGVLTQIGVTDHGNVITPGTVSYDGNTANTMTLLQQNINDTWTAVPIAFTAGGSTALAAQDNPLFLAYYNQVFPTQTWDVLPSGVDGFNLNPNRPADSTMGLTSYVGNAGMCGFNTDTANSGNAQFTEGPFYPDSATRLTDITDGASTTLAFGEALGGPEVGQRTYALTWMGAGVLPSYWDCQTPSAWFTFGSAHANVVNFAFCDGSVRSLSKVPASPADLSPESTGPAQINTPRWTAFQQLAGIRDGFTPAMGQLGLD